jgi:succinate dehydrogenase / fumarate reductase iron-sulfur subunit
MSTQVPEQDEEATETETEAEEAAEPEPDTGPSHQERRLSETERAAERQRREAETPDIEGPTRTLKVFRYDPEVEGKRDPRFDEFVVPFRKGMTVLDGLIYARDHYDSSLTCRQECRKVICGSDAMFVNGRQRLCCKTQISDLDEPVRVEPLPHQEVVKDLVVDMEHFYDQMDAVEPYFQSEDVPEGEEQRQSPENREKIKTSTRCIWCGACTSSCNIVAAGNYLGPAAINMAYRFVMDEREEEELKEHRLEIIDQENGVWRCQTQFSCTEVCPKDIPLTEHIQELKREAVKSNLKFW